MMVRKTNNHVDPVIPSENILALCLNNYELISNNTTNSCQQDLRATTNHYTPPRKNGEADQA